MNVLRILSTLKARLAIAFITLIVVILLAEFVAYWRIQKMPNVLVINSIASNLTNLQKEEISLKGAATEFILLEKNNPQFFQSGKSKFILQYQNSLQKVRRDLEIIEQQTLDIGLADEYEISVVQNALKKYDSVFQAMVAKVKVRGYGKFGVIGEFDNAIMDLVRHDFGADNVAILNLQLYVKEYLLSGNKGASNDVANEIYNFSTVIDKYVRDDQVESVITALTKYEDSFKKLIAVDEQLGTYSNQGLANKLFSAAFTLDAAVQMTGVKANLDSTYSSISSQIYFSILSITAIAIIVALGISWWLNSTIVNPFRSIKKAISSLGIGEIPAPLASTGLRDLNDIVNALNNLILNIQDHHEFADNIGKGNFDASIKNFNDSDILGKALLNMRDSLHRFNLENNHRSWTAQCLAEFTATVGNASNDPKLIGTRMVSKIARDLNAHLAGFYLINEESEDPYLELVSSYGFDKDKLVGTRIHVGQGMLGQAVISRESNYRFPVPKDYYGRITSALGQTPPCSLLIVPLKHNDQSVGAIEVASLTEIPDYKRSYVEKLAENIAAMISSIKLNEQLKVSSRMALSAGLAGALLQIGFNHFALI